MHDDPGFAGFLAEMARVPLLTATEERRLALRVERGDLAAKQRMIEANLRLVVHIARAYQRADHGLSLPDLVQEGTFGLVRAVEKFDPRLGHRFSTYATIWIRQSISRSITNKGRPIRLPASVDQRLHALRRAERELAAETARIGVAEADLYPRLVLLGSIGVAASNASELVDDGSGVLGIGPSLRWNLFDGGARHRAVEAQDARAEQALVRWERAVLLALEETENGMTAFAREQARRTSLLEAATQARRAVELAQTEYTEGLSDFSAVLDSQRALAVLEDELAQSDAAIATNLIALYKALGGGWESATDLAALGTQ